MNYDLVEGLNENQILELYDDVILREHIKISDSCNSVLTVCGGRYTYVYFCQDDNTGKWNSVSGTFDGQYITTAENKLPSTMAPWDCFCQAAGTIRTNGNVYNAALIECSNVPTTYGVCASGRFDNIVPCP